MKTKKKNNAFIPVCAIFICLIEMKTNAKRFYFTIFLFVILLGDICFIVRYMFFAQYLTTKFERRPSKLEKKDISCYSCMGDAEFSIRESQISMGDANYRWEDVSLILFKYWLYFHSQVMPLLHYYDTAVVQNQHQLLMCQTSKWQSLLF